MPRALLLLLALPLLGRADPPPPAVASTGLADYVARDDGAYKVEVVERAEAAGAKVLSARLTSQVWRGTTWTHWLRVIRPATLAHPDALMLVVAGGRVGKPAPKLDGPDVLGLAAVAAQAGCVVAVVEQVPNQPLFESLNEDALIAHTFDQFLKTGESDWPLLLPMVKAASRAIDGVVAIAAGEWSQTLRRACVTGASKRGWTTWLVAAIDHRVVSIAPMVIDTLNFAKQMPHQIATWGAFSEEIEDYTRLELQKRLTEDARSPQLVRLIDPWHYREALGVPKLIVLGTNDRYWPVDAANLYYDDLPGERSLHYVPNAGHGLNKAVVLPIARFFGLVLARAPRPRLVWRESTDAVSLGLVVLADQPPTEARLWQASSATRDFRDAKWTSADLPASDFGGHVARVPRPTEAGHHAAMYVELVFATAGGPLSMSSRIVLAGAAEKPPEPPR